ncbi:MAG: efflux RND transporter permease subunit [Gemmatimonadetes bacterium]|nr:efflux RND transporter permease subunit [Gemmatimonadota bacterium]
MSIPGASTKRPVAVAMLVLAVVLVGAISYARLPIDLLPDVSFPRLVVYTSYPNVAPAEVERLITEPVERQVAQVAGVEQVASISRDGVSLVTVRFAWGTDMDFAALNTRERLDDIRDVLPQSAQRPTILRVDPQAEPIMAVSIAGGGSLLRNKEVARDVFGRRLEQLDGIAQASVTGGLDREIQVNVDRARLEAHSVTLEDISDAIGHANYSARGGTVLRGRYRYPLRTLGEFQTVREIEEAVVARGGEDGSESYRQIRVSDLAEVVDGFSEREEIARYNGAESVGLLVFKESGANTVRVAEDVVETLGVLSEQWPDFTAEVAYSQAEFISDSISNVVQALVLGGALAFVVLFLFLRDPRYPVAIALAIPISVAGAFALMDAFGVSLNVMSLGGLALGVGMLVDNSIVVLENIFRHRQEGRGMIEAAAMGGREVQGAITASTLTTISVFGPIIYVEGVAGELFRSLSLAVAFSLLASLLVAITLLPAMAAHFGRRGAVTPVHDRPHPPPGRVAAVLVLPLRVLRWLASLVASLIRFWVESVGRALMVVLRPLQDSFDRWFGAFAEWYHRLLASALDRRGTVLGIAAASLAGCALLALALDRDLLPDVDQGAFEARLELPEGTQLRVTAEEVALLEERLLNDPDVVAVFSHIGRDVRARGAHGRATGLNTATLRVRLREGAATDEVVRRIDGVREHFPSGALSLESGQATALGQILGGGSSDIAVRVRGEDLERSYPFAERIRDRLEALPETMNARIASERGQPQFQVQVDRDAAARHQIEARVVAETVEKAMRGAVATEFLDFDRKIDVVVRLPDALRHDASTLDRLAVRGIPLRELVVVRETVGPAEIRREDQGRVVTVYADVASGGLADAIAAIEDELAEVSPPRDTRVQVGGESEEMRRSFRDLAYAFALALLLVYMILAAQFESLVHPFTILTAVPLALVGAVLALALTGQGLNTMSLIGIVILVGIVVNDAIVKVDFINRGLGGGQSLTEAVMEAGRVRLRPIVMTTVTTVLGLTPMALGLGRGADLRAPMAISVIGGLLVATALTLIVVPVVYSVIEDARRRWRGRIGAGGGRAPREVARG